MREKNVQDNISTNLYVNQKISGEVAESIKTFWGSILGNIENQTDLMELFESKDQEVLREVTLQILNEANYRLQEDTKLSDRLNEETADRIRADLNLYQLIDDKLDGWEEAVDQVTQNLVAEISNRRTGDTNLGIRIDNEITNRTNADTTLQNNINSLKSYSDGTFATKTELNSEALTRAQNDNTISNALDSFISTVNSTFATKTALNSEVQTRSNNDTTLQNNINSLTLASGRTIDLTIDSSTYKLQAILKNSNGTVISESSIIDLPLETMVTGATYDNTNKKIILILKDGSTVDVPVGDLVDGLQPEITSSNKLASDLVTDTNQEHKFVTSTEKTTWNNKSDFSGSYNDLTDKPTIPAAQVQSNWTQTNTSSVDYIKNKPILATVATSGLYTDLTGTPSLATVATTGDYDDLIDTPSIPSKTSDITNDSGFITNTVNDLTNYTTTSGMNTLLNGKQDTLVAGTGISISGNVISSTVTPGSSSWTDITNKPLINNNSLVTGNNTSASLGLQSELVSGTNIKTINNSSILGSGNINLTTSSDLANYVSKTEAPGYSDILTATDASSTYLTMWDAEDDYVRKFEAPGYDDILTETAAESQYQKKGITLSNVSVSGTPSALASYNAWDNDETYTHYLDVPITGMTSTMTITNFVADTDLMDKIAPFVAPQSNSLRLFTSETNSFSYTIYSISAAEV